MANKLIKRGNISAKDVNKLLNFYFFKKKNKPRLNLSRDSEKDDF